MADIENKEEVAVSEKEVVEEVDAAPKVAAGDDDHAAENGTVADAEGNDSAAGENGTSAEEKKDDSVAAAAAAAKDAGGDESKNGNKECTDAPTEAVKRKIGGEDATDASATDETVATPEKKAKMVDTKESDANGGGGGGGAVETAEVAV